LRAFWCIRSAIQNGDGRWSPSFPAGFEGVGQAQGDLRVFGPDPAPGDHRHAQISMLAIQDDHYHQLFWNDSQDAFYQEWFKTDPGALTHTHTIPVGPSHFLVFVLCSDAMWNLFVAAVGTNLVIGQADITTDDGNASIGNIDNTAWTTQKRTAWKNRIANFGLDLPIAVTNPRRFVRWILAAFQNVSQNIKDDKPYRYTSYKDLG